MGKYTQVKSGQFLEARPPMLSKRPLESEAAGVLEQVSESMRNVLTETKWQRDLKVFVKALDIAHGTAGHETQPSVKVQASSGILISWKFY